MTRYIIIYLLSLTVCSNFVFGKSIIEKLNKGKTLIIEVEPNGDGWNYPSDFHTIKIYKSDSLFIIELLQNNIIQKKEISEQQLIKIADFIDKWIEERQTLWNGKRSLQYDSIKIKIGSKTKRFRSDHFSDKKLLSEIFKE
jgi:hypothetical protein